MEELIYVSIMVFLLIVLIVVQISANMLRKRTKSLEKTNNEMVSNIAHELKTPMTSIVGFVETLQNGAINNPEKARRFLDIISVETARLQNIIDATLEISRLDNLETDVNITEFAFDEIIEECIALLKHAAKMDDISINTFYDTSEKIMVSANKVRIKQVVSNLVGNAIKYNDPHGKVEINVTSRGKNLIFSIFNTGRGIAHENTARLFERFYRVDDGRARDVGGTGLGLSIVKKIVDLYGGRIEVESQPGENATFIVTLPIVSNA